MPLNDNTREKLNKIKTIASLRLVRSLLSKFNTTPIKSLGQVFLVNENIVLKFIKTLNISSDDVVVEIGAGIGTLTFSLCQIAKKVIAIEIDKTKEPILQKVLENFSNYEIIWGDATQINLSNLSTIYNQPIKIIGSLPYNASKKIIHNVLTNQNLNWQLISFLLQKEVAREYVAYPPKSTFLSNFANIYTTIKKVEDVNRINFYPIPKVDSAIVTLRKKQNIDYSYASKMTNLIKQCFAQPRKTLINNIKKKHKLTPIQIKTLLEIIKNKRPAELSLDEWKEVTRIIHE